MTLKLLHLAILSAVAETGCMEGALHILYSLVTNSGKEVSVLIYPWRKAFEAKKKDFYSLTSLSVGLMDKITFLHDFCPLLILHSPGKKKRDKGCLLYFLFLIHTGKQHTTSVYYKCSQVIPYIFRIIMKDIFILLHNNRSWWRHVTCKY